MDEKTLRRFMQKVEKQTEVTSPHVDTPCWLWTGTMNAFGYGFFCARINGKRRTSWLAHRLMLEPTHTTRLDGLVVCHRCDSPACVNPRHLFVGTPADNSRDMREKGRSLKGIARPHQQGAKHHKAKLSAKDVWEIRAQLKRGDTHKKIAQRFGVSRTNISLIASGRRWGHLS